jgi:hypothetical protein
MKDFVRTIGSITLVLLVSITSCKQDGTRDSDKDKNASDRSVTTDNGVTLLIKDADLMQVDSNPEYNTAEWLLTVKKPGRYDVWLSSLTCDTLNLQFADNVTITAGDSRLTKKPVGDEIVTDDKSVKGPWYRADSHMGSIFFSTPGEYQVQIISDKVVPHSSDLSRISVDKHTLINSLILKPMVN